MDIVREILLAIEGSNHDPTDMVELDLPNRQRQLVSYHVHILEEAGLLEAVDFSDDDGHDYRPKRLTWQGHEYLEVIRDPAIWAKTKEQVSAAGGFSLDLMKALAKGFIKQKIEDHTGVKLDI
ncbi:MAG: DUF2513 domain-containing protein [Parvibaculaceae bacterium]